MRILLRTVSFVWLVHVGESAGALYVYMYTHLSSSEDIIAYMYVKVASVGGI